MILLILTIVVLIGISFRCSLSEACLFSLSMADVAELAEKRPRVADMMRKLKESIQKPVAAILIVNNLPPIEHAIPFSDLVLYP